MWLTSGMIWSPCPIRDPRDAELPNVGIVQMLDPETGEMLLG